MEGDQERLATGWQTHAHRGSGACIAEDMQYREQCIPLAWTLGCAPIVVGAEQ